MDPLAPLRAYIESTLAQGFAKEDIIVTLREQGGWTDDAIAGVFRSIESGSVSEHALPAPVATPAQSASTKSEPSAQATTSSPTPPASVAPSTPMPAQSAASVATPPPVLTPDAPLPMVGKSEASIAEVKMDRHHVTAIILGVVGIFLLAGTAFAGYWFFVRDTSPSVPAEVLPDPNELVKDAAAKMSLIKSASYTADMALNATAEMRSKAQLSPEVFSTNAALEIDGVFQRASTSSTSSQLPFDGRIAVDLRGDASMESFSFRFDSKFEFRKIADMIYVKIDKVPEPLVGVLAMSGIGAGQWASLDLVPLYEQMEAQMAESGITNASGETTSLLNATSTWSSFGKYEGLTRASFASTSAMIGSTPVYLVTLTYDPVVLRRVMEEALQKSPGYQTNDPALAPVFDRYLDLMTSVFASSSMTMAIGKTDHLVYRSAVRIPLDVRIDMMDLVPDLKRPYASSSSMMESEELDAPTIAIRGTFTASMNYRAHDQPIMLEAPAGATDLGPLIEGSRAQNHDQRRISDLNQIQLALELYYDANQQYPVTLDPLVGNWLPTLPHDPMDDTPYAYLPLAKNKTQTACDGTKVKCQAYVLGTSLEDKEHAALRADLDLFPKGFKGFFGADLAGCHGEVDRFCYDVSI